ncbi:UDP-N-acetylmuramate dehydrogenase [Pseudomonas japonica]|uniref:UDP-N-acetylmuramate dehydrogenase n=1 Tax=Pseudomonas japonica TaxID=256466 RepID=UPI0015E3DCE7|nr:UDP-N-acetylmuramate dehydrogenase [Pseudomonas japonica]MBA1244914.1 UDP-N-acetylmuramate dehydrogenase [Pseudomonas japonica]MBA1287190.1 UDP-N-acetylmuramate dehydrogenase [Pseudomonas japonica]
MTPAIREAVSLKPYNTFGVDVRAAQFAEVADDAGLIAALAYAEQRHLPVHLLGGGSNVLLLQDVPGLVVRMATRGRRLLETHGSRVMIEAEAGEPWHDFVCWTLQQGLGGMENLSLIPGTVGAAPMQNVGAYGVEVKDVFAGLTALDRHTGQLQDFSVEACRFGYRDSVFKQQPGRWVILRVRFWLDREAPLHLEYGPVRKRLAEQGITAPSPQAVSDAICAIRREKLPDPAVLGNAGSFFKNPVVAQAQAAALQQRWPAMVGYPQPDGQVKLAAGWLIEQAGWKGYRRGDAAVHKDQALVLVNHGAATGQELLALARDIQADIHDRFGVTLEMEPNVLPAT